MSWRVRSNACAYTSMSGLCSEHDRLVADPWVDHPEAGVAWDRDVAPLLDRAPAEAEFVWVLVTANSIVVAIHNWPPTRDAHRSRNFRSVRWKGPGEHYRWVSNYLDTGTLEEELS